MSESSNFDYNKLYSLNYYRLNKDKILEHKKYTITTRMIYYNKLKPNIIGRIILIRVLCEYCSSHYNRKYTLKRQQSKTCLNFQQRQL